MANDTTSTLNEELKMLEGILCQDPETGKYSASSSYLRDYTNRVFGAPFQLLDSVDKRFDTVNPYLGNEYLRNFTLNSPILHIRPGMPKYTGGTTQSKLLQNIRTSYASSNSGNMSFVSSFLTGLASSTIFNAGSKLQRRMFGFRETYYDYMQHVNYMCRSMAIFLNLTDNKKYPTGTFVSVSDTYKEEEFKEFTSIKWENYRMMRHSTVLNPKDYLLKNFQATGLSVVSSVVSNGISGYIDFINPFNNKSLSEIFTSGWEKINEAFDTASETTIIGNVSDKISAVEFVVEPSQFDDILANNVKNSAIETAIDTLRSSIGSEIGYITNSNAAPEILEQAMNFLGNGLESISTNLSGLVQGSGSTGFLTNLFSGAIQSIRGQKMIYPKIYDPADSELNYQFTVNLSSPYGDPYNYYMNIVVPLMHLIALVAPRMVTANTISSPYLVQAYIPGMCTCNLGIITNMTITKNKNSNHVSVNGFPLDIKVTFTITELYNALSISPANDPASFLFNETLNDYMANLAGLIPSVDTYTKQRKATFEALEHYLSSGEFVNDMVSPIVDKIEDIANPFMGR